MNRTLFGLVAILMGHTAFAVVRTVTVDQNTMAPIHLAMGRSTVLHFHEKPGKVVAGNQNYFNIEFTGNDITIQPLGAVTSNLFAYGEYHRYGFILRVGGSEGYDDLVDVRWKSKTIIVPKQTAAPKVYEETKQVSSKNLKVTLNKVFHEKTYHAVELSIQDKGGKPIDSKQVEITAYQNGKVISLKEIAFDREVSEPKFPLKARLFLTLPEKEPIIVKVKASGRNAQISVPKEAL